MNHMRIPVGGLMPGPWLEVAACKGTKIDMFVEESKLNESSKLAAALELCSTCQVKRDCLRFAIENREGWGVWGGTTEYQRRRLIRENLSTPIDQVLENWAVTEAKNEERLRLKLEKQAIAEERARVRELRRNGRISESKKAFNKATKSNKTS